MRDILKPALILFVIATLITATLAFVQNQTQPIIDARIAAELEAAKQIVLPSATSFEMYSIDPAKLPSWHPSYGSEAAVKTIRELFVGTSAVGYEGIVASTLSRGYDASGIKITVGVDKSGTVTGISFGDHKETPGLGTKAMIAPFITQFTGIAPAADVKVVKGGKQQGEVDAVSGATITSRAVALAVSGALAAQRAVATERGPVQATQNEATEGGHDE